MPAKMFCSQRHPMQPDGFGFRREFCVMCCDIRAKRPPIAMHCPECGKSVCKKCVDTYQDAGFAVFLYEENYRLLPEYMDTPTLTPGTELYNMHEEFKDTPLGRKHLANRIEKAEEVVADRKAKLAASEARCTLVGIVKGFICSALGCTASPDFEQFLSKVDPDSLRLYQSNPEVALYLFRGPESSQVYSLHEEFNNTAGFREELTRKIGVAESAVQDLKNKLIASEERALAGCFEQPLLH